jgi:hypothetical protein
MPGEFYLRLDSKSKPTVIKLENADAAKELRKALMEATGPLVPAVKAAARRLPSRDKRTRGSLRSAIANAVKREVKVNTREVSISVASVPSGGKSNLARLVEGEILWAHPVFGRGKVTQPPHPYFYKTIDAYAPGIDTRVNRVLDDLEKKL